MKDTFRFGVACWLCNDQTRTLHGLAQQLAVDRNTQPKFWSIVGALLSQQHNDGPRDLRSGLHVPAESKHAREVYFPGLHPKETR